MLYTTQAALNWRQFAETLIEINSPRTRISHNSLVNEMATVRLTDASGLTGGRGASALAKSARLHREWRTVAAMIYCYCHDLHHQERRLCADCAELLDYCTIRLEKCHFGAEKPACVKCPVHCYQKTRREQIRAVMRYAGPRMVWRHPVLSLRHWVDGWFSKAKLDN